MRERPDRLSPQGEENKTLARKSVSGFTEIAAAATAARTRPSKNN